MHGTQGKGEMILSEWSVTKNQNVAFILPWEIQHFCAPDLEGIFPKSELWTSKEEYCPRTLKIEKRVPPALLMIYFANHVPF